MRTIPQAREGTLYAYIADGEGSIKRLETRQLDLDKRRRQGHIPNDLYELLKRNEGKMVKIITTYGQHLYGTLRIITPMHEDPSTAPKLKEARPRIAYIAVENETTAVVRTDQIKHLEFLEPANLKRDETAAERRLAVVLDGVKDGKPVKVGIASL